MRKVAVTGSLASGKTTVCRLFEELGAFVISADAIVHQLLTPATSIGQSVIALLGQEIVVKGEIRRELIAKKIFDDPFLLKELEKRLHPEVQKVIESTYQEISQKKIPLFVAEVPLLFESNLAHFYDSVIVVTAPQEARRERFMKTTSYDEVAFTKREKRLMPLSEKSQRADIVIENNGSLTTLQQKVKKTFNLLSS